MIYILDQLFDDEHHGLMFLFCVLCYSDDECNVNVVSCNDVVYPYFAMYNG